MKLYFFYIKITSWILIVALITTTCDRGYAHKNKSCLSYPKVFGRNNLCIANSHTVDQNFMEESQRASHKSNSQGLLNRVWQIVRLLTPLKKTHTISLIKSNYEKKSTQDTPPTEPTSILSHYASHIAPINPAIPQEASNRDPQHHSYSYAQLRKHYAVLEARLSEWAQLSWYSMVQSSKTSAIKEIEDQLQLLKPAIQEISDQQNQKELRSFHARLWKCLIYFKKIHTLCQTAEFPRQLDQAIRMYQWYGTGMHEPRVLQQKYAHTPESYISTFFSFQNNTWDVFTQEVTEIVSQSTWLERIYTYNLQENSRLDKRFNRAFNLLHDMQTVTALKAYFQQTRETIQPYRHDPDISPTQQREIETFIERLTFICHMIEKINIPEWQQEYSAWAQRIKNAGTLFKTQCDQMKKLSDPRAYTLPWLHARKETLQQMSQLINNYIPESQDIEGTYHSVIVDYIQKVCRCYGLQNRNMIFSVITRTILSLKRIPGLNSIIGLLKHH